jgi:membrane-associated phospholipid phosphatase
MKFKHLTCLAISLFVVSLAHADLPDTAKHTVALETLGQDIISPVTTRARYALIAGTALTLTTMAFKKQFEEPINDQMQEYRPLGPNSGGDKAGQLIPNVLYFGSMLGIYAFNHDSTSLRRADLMFRTTLHSGVMTLLMKAIFQAERPYDKNVKTSFPSGHSSSIFAFASAVAMEHEWYWGVGAYTLATYVGASRINDHQHHLRDVIAGATVGVSYGMGIYYRMLNEQSAGATAGSGRNENFFALVPTNELDGAAFMLRRQF